jgi:hypothetical protein
MDLITLLAASIISVEKETSLAPISEPLPIKTNLSSGKSGSSPMVIAFSILTPIYAATIAKKRKIEKFLR